MGLRCVIVKRRRPRTGLAEVSGVRPGRPRQMWSGKLDITPPPDVGQLVLVGEVISHLPVKSLLESVTEPLGKVLRGSPNGCPAILTGLYVHDSAQRIVDHGAIGFITEQMLDLNAVSIEEPSFEMNVATGEAGLFDLAGRAGDDRRRPEMRVTAIRLSGPGQGPAPIGIDIAADFADRRLRHRRLPAVLTSLVVDTVGKCLIGVSLCGSHDIPLIPH